MKLPLQPTRLATLPEADDAPIAPAEIEPVVLVHGTFANVRKETGVDWWQPGSEFCRQLDALLQSAGSKARCWAHLSQRAPQARVVPPFAWTGANTERARLEAGRALAQTLGALESDPGVERYHLVAHSHGGNVAINALRGLARMPAKLGTVVYMGTPYLSFRHARLPDMRWLSIPLYVAALAFCIWGYRQAAEDQQILWGTGALALVLSLLAEVFLTRGRARRRDQSLYGSGRAKAFVFSGDEAIKGLILAQEIARHPLNFVRQFVAPSEPKARAVDFTSAPARGFGNVLGDSGISVLLDTLQKSPSTGYAGGLHLQGASVDAPGSRVAPQWRSTWDIFETLLNNFPLRAHLTFFLWATLLAPWLVVTAVAGLGSFLLWLVGMLARGLGLVLAIGFAALALPRLIRKGVFGADEGRFVEVREMPPGVAKPEPLHGDVLTALAGVEAQLGGLAGLSVLKAVGGTDAFSIKTYVEKALTDAELTHSYYYKAPGIIEAAAAFIASPPPAPPSLPDFSSMSVAEREAFAAAMRKIKLS